MNSPAMNSGGAGAVVTGGGSGIGTAVCQQLAAAGQTVAVLDRDAATAASVAEEIGGVALVVDVADSAAVTSAIDGFAAEHGLRSLVNSAGVGNLKRLEDYSDAEIDLIWRVNFSGTYNCLRAAVPHLRATAGASAGTRTGASGSGSAGPGPAVVNIASVSGVRPTRGEAPYSAAKAAVVALTHSAALEWAPQVRVNCVSPGFIRTPLNEMLAGDDAMRASMEERTPAHRLGTARETAEVIAFLLSDAAGYLTGQNIVLDGGSMLNSAQMDPVLGPLLG